MDIDNFYDLIEKLSVGPGLSDEITHNVTLTQTEMKAISGAVKICLFLGKTGLIHEIIEAMPQQHSN